MTLEGGAGGLELYLQGVHDASRIHLDIETDNVEAEVQRLEKQGRVGKRPSRPGGSWKILWSPLLRGARAQRGFLGTGSRVGRVNSTWKGHTGMFSELDTDAFLAYAKAHHRDLVQQAEMDALRRRASSRSRTRHPGPDTARRCCVASGIAGALRLRCYTLWQRWVLVARTWASGHPSQAPRTSRG